MAKNIYFNYLIFNSVILEAAKIFTINILGFFLLAPKAGQMSKSIVELGTSLLPLK